MKSSFLSILILISLASLAQEVELVVPRHHTGLVSGMVFSPDAKFLITYADDRSIILRETSSGNYLRGFEAENQIREIKFFPDSRQFLVNTDSGLYLLDITKKKALQKIDGNYLSIETNKLREEFLTIESNGAVKIFKLANNLFQFNKTIDTLNSEQSACVYSEDGNKIVMVNRGVKLYDLQTGKASQLKLNQIPDSLIKSVALHSNNYTLAVGLANGSVKIYDLNKNTIESTLDVYHAYWSGDPNRGIYRDSIKLTDQPRHLEFMDSKRLAAYYSPYSSNSKPGTNFKFKISNSQYADPEDLDKMWNALDKELEAAGDEESMQQESDWWGARPTIAIWDITNKAITYTSTQAELYAYSNEFIATPHAIERPALYESFSIEGYNTSIDLVKFTPSADKLMLKLNYKASILDLQQGKLISIPYPIRSENFSLHKKLIAVESVQFYDTDLEKLVKDFPQVSSTSMILNPMKEQIAAINYGDSLVVHDFSGKTLFAKKYAKSSKKMQFSTDGNLFFIRAGYEANIFSTSDFSLIDSIPSMSSDGYQYHVEDAVLGINRIFYRPQYTDGKIIVRDFKNHSNIDTITIGLSFNKMCLSPDENMLLVSTSGGELVSVFFKERNKIKKWKAHEGYINSIDFSSDGKFIVTAGGGLIKFWNAQTLKLEARLLFYDNDWVVVNSDGLFDGSPGGLEKLFFINGLQTIDLTQLKDRFYEPGLLSKVMGTSKELLRKSQGLNDIKMFPKISIDQPRPEEKNMLAIHLSNQGGGIGKVKISINGKEAAADARGVMPVKSANQITIPFDLKDHPFLKSNELNLVEVRAFNEDGYLESPPKKIYYFAEGAEQSNAKLFAIVIGTSDYNGNLLDLRFAAKDAEQFGLALSEAGARLFGKDKVNVTILSTNRKDSWPTKTNIAAAFELAGKKAKANDILIVYLAGHGTNYGTEESDFYYLTANAQSGNLNDPAVRKEVAISSREFTEYIKMVPALKQIMILDACHSGKFAEDLLAKREAKSSSEIRALERMKDRTGMYVLSGSAADAVSYEASAYGQGLLTYSLLFGIKGGALRDKQYVDVMSLFQFCADEVPRLAQNIGGIQKPELRVPYGAESFDIGLVDEETNKRIILPTPKPVFTRSIFQDEESFGDPIGLSDLLDDKLKQHQIEGTNSVIFVDAMKFSDGYSLRGRYKKQGDTYQVTFKLFKGDSPISSLQASGAAADQLAEQIAQLGLVKAQLNK